jgi:tRNA A37 threonylcarbamoyladenosine biosynthesis protein TsaE
MSLFKVHTITKKKAVKKIKGDTNLRKDVLIRQEIKSQTFLLQKLYEKKHTKSKSTEESYDTYTFCSIHTKRDQKNVINDQYQFRESKDINKLHIDEMLPNLSESNSINNIIDMMWAA